MGTSLQDPALLKALGTFHILAGKGKTLAELRVRQACLQGSWKANFARCRAAMHGPMCHALTAQAAGVHVNRSWPTEHGHACDGHPG